MLRIRPRADFWRCSNAAREAWKVPLRSMSITVPKPLGDKPAALIRDSNTDLLHYRSDERGYSLITVTPNDVRCDFRTTKFPAGSEAELKTQASYVVKNGKAGPQVA